MSDLDRELLQLAELDIGLSAVSVDATEIASANMRANQEVIQARSRALQAEIGKRRDATALPDE